MIKKLFLLISFLIFSVGSVYADTLFLLSNHDNAGDRNQLLGISRAYKGEPKVEELDTKTNPTATVRDKVAEASVNDNVIVIGSGEGGISGVQAITPQKNVVVCLSSHMVLEGYSDPDLMEKVTFLALPSHASESVSEGWKSKLIPTTGVAHNRTSEDAQKAYSLGKDTLPACESYFGVYLAGDAPTPSKEIKLFTPEEARDLADYVAKEAGESCVLVLNGPRTGKHDADKQEIKTAHRDGALDRVTAAFKERLESKMGPDKVHVIDFQFDGLKLGYNTFDLVLGALLEKGGAILVPGESTSAISEAIDVLPTRRVTIYKNGAMNEVHEKHVFREGAAGRAAVLANTSGKPESYYFIEGERNATSAAQTIAERLWQAVH